MNKQILQHTDMDVYTSLINAINSNLRCHTFAKITAIYNEEQTDEIKRWQYTIDAQPIVDEFILAKENGKEVDKAISLPEIYNIPYISNSPPQVGDYCILLHLDRAISSIKNPKEDGHIDSIGRMHELTDCIAICGVFKPVTQYYQHNIRLYEEKTSDDYDGNIYDVYMSFITTNPEPFTKIGFYTFFVTNYPNSKDRISATGRLKFGKIADAKYYPIIYVAGSKDVYTITAYCLSEFGTSGIQIGRSVAEFSDVVCKI